MNTDEMLRQMFHEQIDLMKDMLERGEMIYGGDRENPGYKRFKQETMRVHYDAIDSFWTLLQENGLIEKCECNAMARGWTDCEICGGAGFKAKAEKKVVAIYTAPADAEGKPIVPAEMKAWADEHGINLIEGAVDDIPTDFLGV